MRPARAPLGLLPDSFSRPMECTYSALTSGNFMTLIVMSVHLLIVCA